jgi:long-chain fatty acid transport protein
VAVGIQRRLSQQLSLRAGYTFNQNPINNDEAFFNLASALIYQHMISAGATYELSDVWAINLAYSHMPDISRTGPVILPGVGAVPGSSVSNSINTHFLSFGVSARF